MDAGDIIERYKPLDPKGFLEAILCASIIDDASKAIEYDLKRKPDVQEVAGLVYV